MLLITHFKPPVGCGRLFVLFAFYVGQHARTGSIWLFLSYADTEYKPKPLVAPGPKKNCIALQKVTFTRRDYSTRSNAMKRETKGEA